jgi:uncharacterized protein YbgA (DUF1722 family)/uncharacterized protein YbbK (DUF523 family)
LEIRRFHLNKIKLGISTCLLGKNVRYDGGHKLDHFLVDTLGNYVEWVPVCPEVECGLPIPRESMHLEGDEKEQKLITSRTKRDITPQMNRWIGPALDRLEKEKLNGYIFKKSSPSSALNNAKIYNKNGIPFAKGPGIFAKAFLKRFPLLPVEDEGRLNDPVLRELFIEAIFIHARWQDFCRRPSLKKLVEFHTAHKLILMAHSPEKLRELGRIVGTVKSLVKAVDSYGTALTGILSIKTTAKKHTNVLQHVMGHFKKNLTSQEKQELLNVIESYRLELIPLIVPITLLKHYAGKYPDEFLSKQIYLDPHPLELKLQNHA